MDLKYVGPLEVDIPELGVTVKPGDQFEATGDTAKSLLKQGVAERVPDDKKAGE